MRTMEERSQRARAQFVARMARLRTDHEESHSSIASLLDVTRADVEAWDSLDPEGPGPTARQILRLSEHYGVTAAFILLGDEHEVEYEEDPALTAFFETDLGRCALENGLRPALAALIVPSAPSTTLYAKLARTILDSRAQGERNRERDGGASD